MESYPFDREKELASRGTYLYGLRNETVTRYTTPITPKENMIRILSRKRPLWLESDINTIHPKLVKDNIARGLVNEVEPFDISQAGGEDWFGIHWIYDSLTRGSMVKPGAPKIPDITEWEKYLEFPDLDSLNWEEEGAKNECLQDPERLTGTTIFTGLFERLISFCDFENAAVALIDPDEQESVHRLFDRLALFYDRLIDKLHTYFHVEHITFHDDWGSQRSAFYSRELCEEMLLPYMKRIVDSCHKRGIWFNFHSCGKIETLVPVMIEAGMDSWGGQEINDKWALYKKYGDKMIFTIDDKLPASMTKEEVETWVDNCLARLDPDKNMLFAANRHPALREILYCKSREFYWEHRKEEV
ncbi:hypothetical protein C0033_18015 [Clostridium sp. chh4-2]|uniref:uroporphyrinogen decarboxylase family protein n=1 Tax=Clostridium sp. chh4-2 TaxID=2067550 RepID=UPI000CCF5020|nr:uroporphyrinogen decarboxylase family protein [Clostridium sp. chh4-2]PNV60659.1 hypothetical protein C0033_18015 [Clostridium sp. chh4-2]